MAETAQERRARIRKRLKEADTPQAEVNQSFVGKPPPEHVVTEKHDVSENIDRAESTGEDDSYSPPKPSSGAIRDRALQRRRDKPTNYKVHVVTALGLAIAIRIAALGPKAVIGGR